MEKSTNSLIDHTAVFNLTYGLFLLTAKEEDKDNGCIINTAVQITENPLRITIALNKANYTHDMIINTGIFNISVLTQSVTFATFEHFGFHSGRDTDKFADIKSPKRTTNNIIYLSEHVNAVLSARVQETVSFETHSLFIAEITESFVLAKEPSVTYQYYFDNIKPKPQPAGQTADKKKGFVCIICGYVYEGEPLPEDFICPLCKHGAADFEPL